MRFLERLFISRPTRIAIILLWLILGGLGGSFAQRFQDVQKNEEASFLPGSSESGARRAAASRDLAAPSRGRALDAEAARSWLVGRRSGSLGRSLPNGSLAGRWRWPAAVPDDQLGR